MEHQVPKPRKRIVVDDAVKALKERILRKGTKLRRVNDNGKKRYILLNVR